MAIIGNIFLLLSTLNFILLLFILGKEAPRGGDAVVGYAWSVLLLYAAFFVLIAISAAAIGGAGGFDWVSPNKTSRFLWVALGVIACVVTSGAAIMFKDEPGTPTAAFKWLSGFIGMLIPFIMVVTGFILANAGLREGVPPAVYKIPLIGIFSVGVLGLGVIVIGWFIVSNKNAIRRMQSDKEFYDRNQERMLGEIDTCDVSKNMVFILVFTDANQTPEVRERAVAKVKTNPHWQEELVGRLRNDWAPEAFNFLASNEVEDKNMFLEPVREGILIQAKLIRESIRNSSHPSHFYPARFAWEVERVLRTVDRFEGLGTDYRPAVRELRAALDEPCDVEKTKLDCMDMLDYWLEKHQ